MLAGLFATMALLFAPAPAEADPVPLVRIDMPPGGMPPRKCDGWTKVSVIGEGRYRIQIHEGEPRRWVEREGVADRRRLLVILQPRKADRTRCGRIIIEADPDQTYANVLSTISMLRYNGFKRISLVDTNDYRSMSTGE